MLALEHKVLQLWNFLKAKGSAAKIFTASFENI